MKRFGMFMFLVPAVAGLIVVPALVIATDTPDTKKDAATGAEWFQWRGPARNGISPETDWLTQWPEKGPTQLWKRNVGPGFSSVSTRGDRVYTMGSDGEQHVVYCLNAADGKVLWKHSYASKKGRYPGPRATPTIDGDRVYTFGREGNVFCFDAVKGKVLWSKNVQKDLGVASLRWGLAGSPLVEGKLLILSAGKCGVALDKTTGQVVWTVDSSGGTCYASPVALDHKGSRYVIFMAGAEAVCAKVTDGSVLWRYPWKPKRANNCADAIVSGDKVFLSSAYGGGCALLKIGDGKPSVLWQHKKMNNHFGSCVLLDGHLYGFNGDIRSPAQLTCLDIQTGEVKWTHDIKGSLMAADGKLIILSEDGQLVLAEASAAGFKEIARARVLSKKCWPPPALSGGRLYCRNDQGDLVCLDLRKPEK